MAVSSTRPDPSSPASVAEAAFSTSRKGYDPDEVRALLRAVAGELGRLQERERALERELRTARTTGETAPAELDEETVTRLLGEETMRVLHTARESASQIKIKAEEGAARIVREATEEANRIRQEADVEAARRRNDAAADAEAEVSLAKQQGREMVNEARAYRERVLSELTRRREVARQQIEQLVAGRDRLMQAFERARLVAIDVVSELAPLDEPEELIDLSPTTGPIPIVDPADREAAERADEPPEAEAVAPVEGDNVVELFPGDEGGAGQRATPDAAKADVDDIFARLRAESAGPEAGDHADEFELEPAVTEDVPVDDGVVDDGVVDDGVVDDAPVDDVPVDDGAVDDGAVDDDSMFTQRDAELTPLIVSGARKLKRVLADEQNDVLDRLRRKEPVTDLAAILPDADDHAARYATAVAKEIASAADAGAHLLGDPADAVVRARLDAADALEPVRVAIRAELVVPLRDRIERAVVDGSGDNDDITKRVRAVYREWKTQHIDDQLDDVFRLAHGTGVLLAVEPGTPLCWAVDPNGPACPDAEDNALAGVIPAGDKYPTGHVCAPAHAGCRCLLATPDQ